MDSTKICIIGLLCVLLCVLLGEFKSSFSAVIKMSCSLLLFLFALGTLSPVLDFFKSMGEGSSISSYMSIIIRALGISFCSSISSDICRDAGTPALASAIELVSKVEIIVLTLPLIKEIINIAEGVMM